MQINKIILFLRKQHFLLETVVTIPLSGRVKAISGLKTIKNVQNKTTLFPTTSSPFKIETIWRF